MTQSTEQGRPIKEELKTNDVVGRIDGDLLRISVEVGRPALGTTYRQVEKVSMALASIGCEFEKNFDTTLLMEDPETGRFPQEVLDQWVKYAPVSGSLPFSKMGSFLDALGDLEDELDTVAVASVIVRLQEDGSVPDLGEEERFWQVVRPNGKVNLGLGRATEVEGR